MTKKISVKRILTLAMALCMIATAFTCFGISASAYADNVSLYLEDTYYSQSGTLRKYIYVKTDGSASEQEVTIHYYEGRYAEWTDAEAEYFTTLSDGSKLWKADIWQYGANNNDSYKYCIKYVADGRTYWDNNHGSNYKNEPLGTAAVTVNRVNSIFSKDRPQTVTAVLQNYAYHKNVFVRVTNDGWNSYTDIPMSYSETNADGTENWTAPVTMTAKSYKDFEFCVCYQVNGREYWANNFGENYPDNYRVFP